ncbi:holin [Streptomyces sp. NPDC021622]
MTSAFWKATTERVVRTFAQSLAAVLTAGATDLLTETVRTQE